MTLSRRTPSPWPTSCNWMVTADVPQVNRMVVWRAWQDLGITEVPLNSNRGPEVDRYLLRAGVPRELIDAGKGYWCAAAVGAWFIDAGAKVPLDYASCDAWLPYMTDTPVIGAAVLYGKRGANGFFDAQHIEVVARMDPIVLTIGGNKAFHGNSNNGIAVDLGHQSRTDVLGYVHPVAARGW